MERHRPGGSPASKVFFLLFFLCTLVPASSNNNPRILILNSYHTGFPWSDGIMEGIKDIFYSKLPYPEITFEYMDTKRHFTGLESELIAHYRSVYRLKYEKDYFDIIIVSDDNAFQFSLRYGDKLFGNTPVVFCGVNNYSSSMLSGKSHYTGVVEKPDDRATIRLMLGLHPEVKKVAFVTDWTTSGKGNRQRLGEIAEEMSDEADFFFLDPGGGLTVEELKQKVEKLEQDTAIFYKDFFKDKNGTYLAPEVFMPELTSIADVPIYSIGSFYLGLGIVGGKMDSAREHGDIAARLAIDILQGTEPSDIPVIDKAITKYMFDYKALKRFDIKRTDLPQNSIIINRPFSFYHQYTEVFWASAAVFIVLLCLSLVLFIILGKSRLANRKLEETVGKLTATLDSIGDAVITTDIVGNITSANPVAEKLLGYSQHDMVGRHLPDFFTVTGDTGEKPLLHPPGRNAIPISNSVAPIRDQHGKEIGTILVFRDKTEEYLFQKSIEDSLNEKTVLLQEIHHRVKNNLNIVISLLNLQAYEEVHDPKTVLVNCRNRVYSMALVHEHLYKYDSLAAISMETYIQEMVSNLYDLYARGREISYSVDVDPISLPIDTAVPTGLILNELITNAFTHAFPGNRQGKIEVALKQANAKQAAMSLPLKTTVPVFPMKPRGRNPHPSDWSWSVSCPNSLTQNFRAGAEPGRSTPW